MNDMISAEEVMEFVIWQETSQSSILEDKMRTSTAMSQPDDSSSIRTFFSLSEVEQSKHPLEIRFYVYRADENVNIQ